MISQDFLGLPVLPRFTMFCKILKEICKYLQDSLVKYEKTVIQDACRKDLTFSHRGTS